MPAKPENGRNLEHGVGSNPDSYRELIFERQPEYDNALFTAGHDNTKDIRIFDRNADTVEGDEILASSPNEAQIIVDASMNTARDGLKSGKGLEYGVDKNGDSNCDLLTGHQPEGENALFIEAPNNVDGADTDVASSFKEAPKMFDSANDNYSMETASCQAFKAGSKNIEDANRVNSSGKQIQALDLPRSNPLVPNPNPSQPSSSGIQPKPTPSLTQSNPNHGQPYSDYTKRCPLTSFVKSQPLNSRHLASCTTPALSNTQVDSSGESSDSSNLVIPPGFMPSQDDLVVLREMMKEGVSLVPHEHESKFIVFGQGEG